MSLLVRSPRRLAVRLRGLVEQGRAFRAARTLPFAVGREIQAQLRVCAQRGLEQDGRDVADPSPVSPALVASYLATHGLRTWDDLAQQLRAAPAFTAAHARARAVLGGLPSALALTLLAHAPGPLPSWVIEQALLATHRPEWGFDLDALTRARPEGGIGVRAQDVEVALEQLWAHGPQPQTDMLQARMLGYVVPPAQWARLLDRVGERAGREPNPLRQAAAGAGGVVASREAVPDDLEPLPSPTGGGTYALWMARMRAQSLGQELVGRSIETFFTRLLAGDPGAYAERHDVPSGLPERLDALDGLGHTRDSLVGADRRRPGLLALARHLHAAEAGAEGWHALCAESPPGALALLGHWAEAPPAWWTPGAAAPLLASTSRDQRLAVLERVAAIRTRMTAAMTAAEEPRGPAPTPGTPAAGPSGPPVQGRPGAPSPTVRGAQPSSAESRTGPLPEVPGPVARRASSGP